MPWQFRMLIYISPFILLGQIYILWRLTKAIKNVSHINRKYIVIFDIIVLIFLNLLPITILIYYQTGNLNQIFLNHNQLTWLDFLIVFPYWWGLIIVVESLPYFIFTDILELIFSRLKRLSQMNWKRGLSYIKLTIIVFFIIYVPIRIYFDSYTVRIFEKQIELAELPGWSNNLSITLVGDVQLDRYTQEKKIKEFKDAIEKAEGDLLVFSGDLVTYGEDYIQQGINLMCDLAAPHGSIACMGDHDFWANPERISNGLSSCGWTFLQDEHSVIHYEGHKILITGITNIYSKRISDEAVEKILSTAPEADLRILLIHQPRESIVEISKKYGYHLFLAGHTHGGQIEFHPFGFSFTPTIFENAFYSGYYNFEGIDIFVTNGIGLTLAPVRYHAPAEISKIILKGIKK